jgi:hypothetical protein
MEAKKTNQITPELAIKYHRQFMDYYPKTELFHKSFFWSKLKIYSTDSEKQNELLNKEFESVLEDEFLQLSLAGQDVTIKCLEAAKSEPLTQLQIPFRGHIKEMKGKINLFVKIWNEEGSQMAKITGSSLPHNEIEIGQTLDVFLYLIAISENITGLTNNTIKDHSKLMEKLWHKKYIENINRDVFNNAIENGPYPTEKNKIVWCGKPADANKFCEHFGMVNDGRGRYKTWNHYFILKNGKPLYENTKSDNSGGDIIDLLENEGYPEGYLKPIKK